MASSTRSIAALVVAAGLALPSGEALARAPSSTWDVADQLAAQGEHDEAAEHYARAYEETKAVAILYSWAQSARLAGDCETAIELYARFGTEGASPPPAYDTEALRARWNQMLGNAQAQRAVCAERIAAAEQTDGTDGTDGTDAESTPSRPDAPRTPPPGPDPTVDRDADATPVRGSADSLEGEDGRRRPDAVGWTLVGVGGSIALAGAAFVAIAAGRDARAGRDGTHDEFLGELRRARIEQGIGYAALGAGVALAVGGAIRLGVAARRRPEGPGRVALGRGLSVRF